MILSDGSTQFKDGSPFPIADGNFGTALLPGSSRRAAHGGSQDRIGLGDGSEGCKPGSRVTALQLLQLLQLEFIMSDPLLQTT